MTFSTVRRSTLREWPESRTSAACSTPLRRSSIDTSSRTSLFGFWSSAGSLIGNSWSSISPLDIQVFHEFSVSLDETLTKLHLCAHQLVKDSVGFLGIIYLDLHQY